MKPVHVGICGLGTVGSGTFNVLQRNAAAISRRAGRDIRVTHVASRKPHPDCDLAKVRFSNDVFAVVHDPEVDVVVELMGGIDTAYELVMAAIAAHKHVVTANKAMIALHGDALFSAAEAAGVTIAFEASVAGGIPIIKALREGLVGNEIQWLAGIINGTGNFILTEMRDKGRDFSDVLQEAQALGYAEADPTFDVEGIDAAHKLTILASIAFGVPLQFANVFTEGISDVSPSDVGYAEQLGYRIKHLGIARQTAAGIEVRVHPTLIPEERLLANVNGVLNAVMVYGDAVGATLYYGPGAGSEATASSVVADLVDLSRLSSGARSVPHLGHHQWTEGVEVVPMTEVETSYYLRLQVTDEVGVMARIANILSDFGINIEAIIQKEPEPGDDTVPLILLTQRVREKEMNAAIDQLEGQSSVIGRVTRIRVEQLSES